MNSESKRYHEANRASWNAATKVHNTHKGDQIAFFRKGGNTLYPEEIELLGDVRGKTLLHLQCNAGQDTLSIARHLGAICTGVDISDEAITFAQQLSAESGIPATFIRADIFEWFAENTFHFDTIFTSYGAICWLADLGPWGAGIAKSLRPGGQLVVMEFHPAMLTFDEKWQLKYDYMGGKVFYDGVGVGDYVGEATDLAKDNTERGSFQNPHPSYEFAWGLGEIVTALIDAGLQIKTLREYPFVNGWRPFEDMRTEPGKRHYPPDHLPALPMMFGIRATRPE